MKKKSHELLSLTSQPMHMGGKLYMSFTAGYAFDLATSQPIEPTDAYAAAMKALAPGDCFDLGLPKKEAEWLLAGSAFAGGETVKRMAVSAEVGKTSRRFVVESREPFSSMALTWDATWGNDDENPTGVRPGTKEKPTVTDADAAYDTPASMGPRGAWPCRMNQLGTFDDKWLKENWPGLPDDADWGFYNLSQPTQRLTSGLNGGEKITLVNLNEKISKIESRVPNASVIFKFDSGDRTFEKRPTADTLWLFPNECVGLMLWHTVVECENEAGLGIASAEAELEIDGKVPKAITVEPQAAPVSNEIPSAAAKSAAAAKAAAAVGAAVVGSAAVASASDENIAQSEEKATEGPISEDADSAKAEETAQGFSMESPAAAEAEAAAPLVSAAEVRAKAYAELDNSLPEINAALAQAGLPPLSPEQVEETRAHIDKLTAAMDELQAKIAETKPPTLEEALQKAGATNEQIESVQKALDIPVPSPHDFTDKASWEKASESFISEFSSVIGADEKTTEMMKSLFAAMPVGEQTKAVTDPTAKSIEVFTNIGMDPDVAAKFVAVLEEDVPSDPDALLKYAERVEQVAGFPEGSVSGHIKQVQEKMEELGVPMGSLSANALSADLPTEAQEIIEAQKTAEAQMAETQETEQETAKSQSDEEKGETLKAEKLPLTAENLPAIIASGIPLAGLKLDGFNLSGFNFSGFDLKGISFVGAILNGARFDGAKLAGASFVGAALKESSFVGADLGQADFSSVDASDADFSDAIMSGANFAGASLVGATLSKTKGDGISAAGADLSRARISFSDISGGDFSGANLNKADFHEVCADKANFAKAQMGGSTFGFGSTSRESSFAEADLSGANWTNAEITGSDFTHVSARGASFTDCDISQSNWTEADAAGGDFSRSSVEGSSMRGINLLKGSLREARASGADLSESCLFGADLCRIVTDGMTNMHKADIGQTIVEARKG